MTGSARSQAGARDCFSPPCFTRLPGREQAKRARKAKGRKLVKLHGGCTLVVPALLPGSRAISEIRCFCPDKPEIQYKLTTWLSPAIAFVRSDLKGREIC